MKARLVLASAAVGVLGLAGIASAAAEPGTCAEGTTIEVHLDVNGEKTDVCLPPEDGGGAPELPALPAPPPR